MFQNEQRLLSSYDLIKVPLDKFLTFVNDSLRNRKTIQCDGIQKCPNDVNLEKFYRKPETLGHLSHLLPVSAFSHQKLVSQLPGTEICPPPLQVARNELTSIVYFLFTQRLFPDNYRILLGTTAQLTQNELGYYKYI